MFIPKCKKCGGKVISAYTNIEIETNGVLKTTLIISKKPGNTGISRDIRTEFTTDLLLSD